MSQFDLENEIGASAGVISRIESGKVNPTKETVRGIAEALEMNNRELDYLIGVTANPPTEEEANKAIEEIDEYLNKRGSLAYLLDDRWRFHKVSKFFLKILKLKDTEIDQIIGKTTVQVIVDENLPIIKILSDEKYEELLRTHIPYYFAQVYFMRDDKSFIETAKDVQKHPLANEIWQNLSAEKTRRFNPQEMRIVHFKVGPFNIPLKFSRESLFVNSRFEIVEYTPTNELLKLIAQLN